MSEVTVESETHHGNLEVECVIRRADGSVKSVEKSVRPVKFKLDQTGKQVTELQEA